MVALEAMIETIQSLGDEIERTKRLKLACNYSDDTIRNLEHCENVARDLYLMYMLTQENAISEMKEGANENIKNHV